MEERGSLAVVPPGVSPADQSQRQRQHSGGSAAQRKEGEGESKPGRLYYRGMAVHSAFTGRLAQRSSRRAVNSECSAISVEVGVVGGNQGEVHEIYSCRSCSPGCRRFVDGYRGVAEAASVGSVMGLAAGGPP